MLAISDRQLSAGSGEPNTTESVVSAMSTEVEGTEAAEMALHGSEVVDEAHAWNEDASTADESQFYKMIRGMMEIIPKSHVSISKLLGVGGYGEVCHFQA